MSGANLPVVGPPKPSPAPADGSLPLRIEIRDLQANYPDQWNLYLLGLDAFKKQDENSELSYYGIAGIHGRPYRPWGGVKGANRGGWQGYCTHSSIIFAPWHRPYLALFEQILYGVVNEVAGQFPEDTRARYQQAASTFRIPYWDWAADPPSGDAYFPNAVGGSSTIGVITPQSNGQTVQIKNPLYSCNYHPINPQAGDFPAAPYRNWPNTLRYPTSTIKANATSQNDQVFAAMESQFQGLQSDVNILMNDPNYKDFAAFSNHVWQQNEPGTFASIEDLHNSIHVAIGGNMGHMSQLDYSAFDPVFWLHHTNVDRLFAIWQALNPDSYTINERTDDGTFVIAAGSVETATTPLAPFADASGTKYWTSLGARQTETFNYAYPETQQWAFSSQSDYQNSVFNAVQQLYAGVSNEFRDQSFMATPASLPPATVRKSKAESGNPGHEPTTGEASNPAQKPVAEPAAPAPDHHSSGFHPFHDLAHKIKDTISGDHKDNEEERTRGLDLEAEIENASTQPLPAPKDTSYTEYIVTLKAPKHILQQTYVVHVFLGEFGSEANSWYTQDALAGTFAVFGKEPETGCGKCKTDAEEELSVTGTVNLTAALLKEYKRGNLGSLDKENVLPWLRDNLHWRVTLADGTEKDRNEVPGLEVGVVTTKVDLPVGRPPRFSGVYEVHTEVTEGRPAGLSPTNAGAGGPAAPA